MKIIKYSLTLFFLFFFSNRIEASLPVNFTGTNCDLVDANGTIVISFGNNMTAQFVNFYDVTLPAGNYRFKYISSSSFPNSAFIGGNTFPTGNADSSQPFLTIPAGTYNVHFNHYGSKYTFVTNSFAMLITPTMSFNLNDLGNGDYGANNLEIAYLNSMVYNSSKFRFGIAAPYTTHGLIGFPSGVLAPPNAWVWLYIPSGTYDVVLHDDGSYLFKNSLLSNEDFELEEHLKVYPNPTNNFWNFSLDDKKIESINIYNIEGKLLFSKNMPENNFQVDCTDFSSGIYMAHLIIDGKFQTIKLIKT
jgi:hypothetical protein